MIKQNKDIKGIFINNIEHKISQYPDDTLLVLDGSHKSLLAALETIYFFSKFFWFYNKFIENKYYLD